MIEQIEQRIPELIVNVSNKLKETGYEIVQDEGFPWHYWLQDNNAQIGYRILAIGDFLFILNYLFENDCINFSRKNNVTKNENE